MQHSPEFLAIVERSRARIQETDVHALKARVDRAEPLAIIDVREDLEFAAKRIPGSVHLGKGVIERDIEARFPDKHQELLLVCGGGFRSALAADAIQQMGYTRAVSVDGGLRLWAEAGYPVDVETI